jgi:hypothetical protein
LLKPTRPKSNKHLTAQAADSGAGVPLLAKSERKLLPPSVCICHVDTLLSTSRRVLSCRLSKLQPSLVDCPMPDVDYRSLRDVSDLDRGLIWPLGSRAARTGWWLATDVSQLYLRPIRRAVSQPKVVLPSASPTALGHLRDGKRPLITGPSCRQNLGNAGDLYMVALLGGVLTIYTNPTNRRPGCLACPHAIVLEPTPALLTQRSTPDR